MTDEQKDAATLRAEKETKLNEGKTGKGLRTRIGMTRGRNPLEIQYQAFDESQPDTLPTTLSEFMDLAGVKEEKDIVAYLVDGFNSASYVAASDPVSEFIDASWPDDVQKQFRLVVRNYSNATGVSIDDAVALIKPGIVAAQAKAQA